MATKGDKVYLKAKPQFFQPAGEPVNGFYRNGAVPGDSIVNDWITDNYNDCTFLGEIQEINAKVYYLVRLNFTYRKHGLFGIAKSVKSSEDLWFLEEDVSFEYVETQADKDEAEKKAIKDKILAGIDTPIAAAGSGNQSSSISTTLIAAIVAGVAVLGGVLWWAFGKKKNQGPVPAQMPTIIQLSKPSGRPINTAKKQA